MVEDALIQEINDDVRREKMQRLWRHIRMPLFIAVALLVSGTAGISIYNHYEEQARQESTQAFLDAIKLYNETNFEAAITAFDAAAEIANDEVADLTQLWKAKSQLALEQQDDAITGFADLANNPEAIDRVRDLSCVHLFALSATELPDYCTGDAASPLRSGLSLLYAAHLWQTGRVDTAKETLQRITLNANAPNEVRETASRYLATINAEHAK